MKSAQEVMIEVGGRAMLSVEGGKLRVRVRILDGREVWGRTDYLVLPEAGAGETWVSADRVRTIDTYGAR